MQTSTSSNSLSTSAHSVKANANAANKPPQPLTPPLNPYSPQEIASFQKLDLALRSHPELAREGATLLNPKALARLVQGVKFFQDTHLGRHPSSKYAENKRWPLMKFPDEFFRMRSPDGPLFHLFVSAYRYKKDASWRQFDFQSKNRYSDNIALMKKIQQDLLADGMLQRPVIYLDPSVPKEMRAEYKATLRKFGGRTVKDIAGTGENAPTHVVCWDAEEHDSEETLKGEEEAGEEIQKLFLKTLTIVDPKAKVKKSGGIIETTMQDSKKKGGKIKHGKGGPPIVFEHPMAFVHWWYHPSSYDEWMPAADVAGADTDIPPRPPGGPWIVGCKFIRDVARFNEWGVEADYAVSDYEKKVKSYAELEKKLAAEAKAREAAKPLKIRLSLASMKSDKAKKESLEVEVEEEKKPEEVEPEPEKPPKRKSIYLGMTPKQVFTGFYSDSNKRLKRTVYDGALRIPPGALEIVRNAIQELRPGALEGLETKFNLPDLDSTLRPSLDPALSSKFTVTELNAGKNGTTIVTARRLVPPQVRPERIRGGGEDVEMEDVSKAPQDVPNNITVQPQTSVNPPTTAAYSNATLAQPANPAPVTAPSPAVATTPAIGQTAPATVPTFTQNQKPTPVAPVAPAQVAAAANNVQKQSIPVTVVTAAAVPIPNPTPVPVVAAPPAQAPAPVTVAPVDTTVQPPVPVQNHQPTPVPAVAAPAPVPATAVAPVQAPIQTTSVILNPLSQVITNAAPKQQAAPAPIAVVTAATAMSTFQNQQPVVQRPTVPSALPSQGTVNAVQNQQVAQAPTPAVAAVTAQPLLTRPLAAAPSVAPVPVPTLTKVVGTPLLATAHDPQAAFKPPQATLPQTLTPMQLAQQGSTSLSTPSVQPGVQTGVVGQGSVTAPAPSTPSTQTPIASSSSVGAGQNPASLRQAPLPTGPITIQQSKTPVILSTVPVAAAALPTTTGSNANVIAAPASSPAPAPSPAPASSPAPSPAPKPRPEPKPVGATISDVAAQKKLSKKALAKEEREEEEKPLSGEQEPTTILPSWYDSNAVSKVEKTVLPEWFNKSAVHRTEETYIVARERILKVARKSAAKYLTATSVRRCVPGDAGSIMRLHRFLVTWGFINGSAIGDSAPLQVTKETPPESIPASEKKWSAQMTIALGLAVDEFSSRKRQLDDGAEDKIHIDWDGVAKKVGGEMTPDDCYQKFLSTDFSDNQSVSSNVKIVDMSATAEDTSREDLIADLIDGVKPQVAQVVIDAALNATNGDVSTAKRAAVLGAISSQAVERAQKEEAATSHILQQILDLRMAKLENRLSLLDDLEGMLDAERVALELERRDLYTNRCRHWFNADT